MYHMMIQMTTETVVMKTGWVTAVLVTAACQVEVTTFHLAVQGRPIPHCRVHDDMNFRTVNDEIEKILKRLVMFETNFI